MVADAVMTRKDRAASVALSARVDLEAQLEADHAQAQARAADAFARGEYAQVRSTRIVRGSRTQHARDTGSGWIDGAHIRL